MGLDFRTVADSSPDGVLIVSEAGAIVYANVEAERLLGYPADELLGSPLEMLVPERYRALHLDQREGYTLNPSKRAMGKLPGITARRRDGSSLPVDIALSPLEPGTIVATIRDATARVRVERELRELAEMLQARVSERDRQARTLQSILDSIGDGVIVLDHASRLQLINPTALRIFPAARIDGACPPFAQLAELSGALMPDKATPCSIDKLLLEPVLEGRSVDRFEIFVRPSAAAEGVWASISAGPVTDANGQVTGAVLAIRDTTERKAAQEALLAAQEGERKRIARELHDSASQVLCSVILEMEKILAEIPASDIKRRFATQKDSLMELSDELSSVAHRLHPAILERVGLAEALRWICREFHSKGFHVEYLERDVPTSVSASSALCVYRVVQEGLRNILRHAKTKTAQVILTSDGANLHLSIIDSGVGFDAGAAAAKGGLGLVSIRERVRLAGGTVNTYSRPGHGTRHEVSVPVDAQSGHAVPR